MTGAVFEHDAGELGRITVHPLVPDEDIDVVYGWVSQDHARYWGMLGRTRAEVLEIYRFVDSLPTHHAYLARRGGVPVGLLQTYDPAADPLGEHYEVQPGDVGIHLLCAPPDGRGERGFTSALLATLVAFALHDPAARRVVAEPDARNDKILRLFRRNGFQLGQELHLDEKIARFAVSAGPLPYDHPARTTTRVDGDTT